MATVTKDFRIKSGLVVEGLNATVNNKKVLVEDDSSDLLTEGAENLFFTNERAIAAVGGSATSSNTPDTVVKRDGSGNFEAGTIYAQTAGVFGATGTLSINGDTISQTAGELTITDGASDIYNSGTFTGNLTGNVTGNVVGNVTGNVTGNLTGSVTGNVTGDLTGNVDINGGTLINLSEPINDSDAATKFYVDAAVAGLEWKSAVNLFADANVALTGATDTLVVDGHAALDTADGGEYRLLLTAQTDDAENGIYTYTDDGSNYALVRSSDADAFSELSSAAIFVMEGTSYGSTSWVQSNHYISDFTSQTWIQFSGQGTYTAGTGLLIDGNEFAVDTTVISTKLFATGEADAAETAANLYTDGAITAEQAKIVGGAQTNIAVTYNNATEKYDFVAENGVADSTTADLAEDPSATSTSGTMYFTDVRAQSALQDTAPRFTEIDLDSIAKKFAATLTAPDAGTPVVAYSFDSAEYRTGEFLVKVAYATHTEVSRFVLTLDSANNIAITEYAIVGTNGNGSSVTAEMNSTNVELKITPVYANTTVTVTGTLII
jgi:hypothetical protein